MPSLTHTEFLKALEDKFTAEELCDVLYQNPSQDISQFSLMDSDAQIELYQKLRFDFNGKSILLVRISIQWEYRTASCYRN